MGDYWDNIEFFDLYQIPIKTSLSKILEYEMESGKCVSENSIWYYLSKNPNAIPLFTRKYFDKINWEALSSNPNAIHILEKNLNKIYWGNLYKNPNAVSIIEKNLDKISWEVLSGNPHAILILEKNINKVYWGALSENPSAIRMLENNLNKIIWRRLSRNLNVVKFIKRNPEFLYRLNWNELSRNPNAIPLLKLDLSMVNQSSLIDNPNGWQLLDKYIDDELSSYVIQIKIWPRYIFGKNVYELDFFKFDALFRSIYKKDCIESNAPDLSIIKFPDIIKDSKVLADTVMSCENWYRYAAQNINVIKIDYNKMRESRLGLREELIEMMFRIRNKSKFY